MMKFLLSVAVLSLVSSLSALADAQFGPLRVHPPEGWDVKYQGDHGAQSYTVTRSDGENVLLTFSRWTAPGKKVEIPGFLDSMAERFLAMAKDNPKIKLASENYTKGGFIGEPYSGKFALFTMDGGLMQTIFMFNDGDEIWQGQYTGSSGRWLEAIEILKALKKRE